MARQVAKTLPVIVRGSIPENVVVELWAAYYLDYVKNQGVFSSKHKGEGQNPAPRTEENRA